MQSGVGESTLCFMYHNAQSKRCQRAKHSDQNLCLQGDFRACCAMLANTSRQAGASSTVHAVFDIARSEQPSEVMARAMDDGV